VRLERSLPVAVLVLGAALTAAVVGVVAVTGDDDEEPSPSASPSVVTTKNGYALDVGTSEDGTIAVLGTTCAGERCSVWVRWGLADAPARVVVSGKGEQRLNRLTLGLDGTGWVWDDRDDGGPMWWTATRGETWQRSSGSYRSVASLGPSTWFLSATCPTPATCSSALVSAVADPAGGSALTLPDDQEQPLLLRRVSADEAYLLTGDGVAQPVLWRTGDRARTWGRVTLPASCRGWRVALETLPAELWLDCQSEPTTGGAPATLWRSIDDGRSWTRLPQPPEFRSGALLTLLTPRHAFITGGSMAAVYETVNAGATWREVLPLREAGYGPVRQSSDGALATALGPTDSGRAELRVSLSGNPTWTPVELDP
jgi:hypothetical protein